MGRRQCRSATAHLAAVGDVVVHQKGVVQQFDCDSDAQQVVGVGPERPAGRHTQRGPQRLARPGGILAHRPVEPPAGSPSGIASSIDWRTCLATSRSRSSTAAIRSARSAVLVTTIGGLDGEHDRQPQIGVAVGQQRAAVAPGRNFWPTSTYTVTPRLRPRGHRHRRRARTRHGRRTRSPPVVGEQIAAAQARRRPCRPGRRCAATPRPWRHQGIRPPNEASLGLSFLQIKPGRALALLVRQPGRASQELLRHRQPRPHERLDERTIGFVAFAVTVGTVNGRFLRIVRTIAVRRIRYPDKTVHQFACRAKAFGLNRRQPTNIRLRVQDRGEGSSAKFPLSPISALGTGSSYPE